MSDDQTPQADPPADDSGADAERHYWEEHEKRTEAILNKWFDAKAESVRKTARNGGRTTLPKILADLVFGPEK